LAEDRALFARLLFASLLFARLLVAKAWSAIVGQTETSVRQSRSHPRIKSEGMLLLIAAFGRCPSSGARGGD
jgi:hypothetical protein